MLYTIGNEKAYLRAIAQSEDGKIFKVGKRSGYAGGYVFQSVDEAQKRIDEAYHGQGYAVFGLQTGWHNTEPAVNGWWRTLNNDSEIVVLSPLS